MPQIIRIKRSPDTTVAPTIGQLELGELAINTYDGRLFAERVDQIGNDVIEFIAYQHNGNVARPNFEGQMTFDDQVTFTSNATFNGGVTVPSGFDVDVSDNLSVDGNTTLGTAAGDTVLVNGTSTFIAPVFFNDDTTIGTDATDILTVNSTSTFASNVTINGTLTQNGSATFNDPSTFNDTSTFNSPVQINSSLTLASGQNFTFDGLAFNNAHKFTVKNSAGTIVLGGWLLDTDATINN